MLQAEEIIHLLGEYRNKGEKFSQHRQHIEAAYFIFLRKTSPVLPS